jgi:hypothetical protein
MAQAARASQVYEFDILTATGEAVANAAEHQQRKPPPHRSLSPPRSTTAPSVSASATPETGGKNARAANEATPSLPPSASLAGAGG